MDLRKLNPLLWMRKRREKAAKLENDRIEAIVRRIESNVFLHSELLRMLTPKDLLDARVDRAMRALRQRELDPNLHFIRRGHVVDRRKTSMTAKDAVFQRRSTDKPVRTEDRNEDVIVIETTTISDRVRSYKVDHFEGRGGTADGGGASGDWDTPVRQGFASLDQEVDAEKQTSAVLTPVESYICKASDYAESPSPSPSPEPSPSPYSYDSSPSPSPEPSPSPSDSGGWSSD